MSLTKKPQPPSKKFFLVQTSRVFWRFDQVRNPYRSGDIPAQSHVCLGVFLFWKSPKAAGRQSVKQAARYFLCLFIEGNPHAKV